MFSVGNDYIPRVTNKNLVEREATRGVNRRLWVWKGKQRTRKVDEGTTYSWLLVG